MVRINTPFAILVSALAYAGYCNAYDSNSEFDELIQREPGLFGILKKIPIVGNILGREVPEEISAREFIEDLEFAARDDPELASLIAREPGLFDVLKKIPVVGGIFRREDVDLAALAARDPGLFDVIRKIPIVGGMFRRDENDIPELASREPGLFDVLKKIPVVGSILRRGTSELEELSVRELAEEVRLAARDNYEVAELISRDAIFDLLDTREYETISDLSARELVEAIELTSRNRPELMDVVERSPFFMSLVGGISSRGEIDARDVGSYGEWDELD